MTSFPTRQSKKLTDHNGPVHCLKYSSGSGQYLLTGSTDRTVRLFNPSSSSPLIQSYSAHGYEVLDIDVAQDNARFASVGGDRLVFLWDVATTRTLRRWEGHWARVNCVAFGGEDDSLVVSGSFDATVRIWDAKSNSHKPIQVFDDSKDSISSLAIRDCQIVTGSVDGRLRWYDVRMGKCYTDVVAYPITSLRATRDSTAILLSTLNSKLLLLDRRTGSLLKSYSSHVNVSYRIRSTLGMNDAFVLAGSEDGFIYVWDLLEGTVCEKLKGHDGEVGATAVAFNDAKKEWASAGTDGSVCIWSL